jgi:hypothetical protein
VWIRGGFNGAIQKCTEAKGEDTLLHARNENGMKNLLGLFGFPKEEERGL